MINKFKNSYNHTSISDEYKNYIRQNYIEILRILLIDRTTSSSKKLKNIIWANDNYYDGVNKDLSPTSQILIEYISGDNYKFINPRSLKNCELKTNRTRDRAEVFTPTWVVKDQIDLIDKNIQNLDLETYTKKKWMETTCGEGPYISSRYDMETGESICVANRIGFLDRKLLRINKEVNDKAEWQYLVEEAYKASYGFEWSGDSLLIARENLLYSYEEFYSEKWNEPPSYVLLKKIAEIISYNIFQMDGLKYIIPLSERKKLIYDPQLSFLEKEVEKKWKIKKGKRVKIMNWETNRMEFFDKGVE